MIAPPGPTDITPALLRSWPLPFPDHGGDKQARGQVLVVAGTGEMPGAAILCAVAALRAGAGKLQIATPASAAPLVATNVPEARVVALPETRGGELAGGARASLDALVEQADAIVVGPGLVYSEAVSDLLAAWLMDLPQVPVVLDAAGLGALQSQRHEAARRRAALILTPHALEAAHALACEKADVLADPLGRAIELADIERAVTVVKGATSHIVDGRMPRPPRALPHPRVLGNTYGNVGLATSGSGDTLAGIVGGLAARGADPLQAAVWGVFLHAAAGDALADRFGMLGFLARELLAEVPRIMNGLQPVDADPGSSTGAPQAATDAPARRA